jgi:hypothetical protein
MARFRLHEDAPKWFKNISGEPFKTDFDQYYFCLMAGFASGRSNETAATVEKTDTFPEDYKEASRFLIGLLVMAELRNAGIDLSERDAVRDMFKRLVKPDSSNQLTDWGMRRLNAYASGGYDYLVEQREQKPQSNEELLRDYPQLIERAITANNSS